MRMFDKRRVAVIAVVGLLGALGVLSGATPASAFSPCNDDMGSGDTAFLHGDDIFLGAELGVYSVGNQQHQYYCFAITGGEANQSWIKWELWPTANTGYTGDVYWCNMPLLTTSCGSYALRATGANVNPTTNVNPNGGTTPGTGASVGTGPGTCAYVNGASHCPVSGATLAGVTINEADLIPSVTPYTPTPPCTGVNNTCIPVGATVRLAQDTSNPTLKVDTVAGSHTVDIGRQCVQVNAVC